MVLPLKVSMRDRGSNKTGSKVAPADIYKSQEVGISAWVFLTRLLLSDLRRFQVFIRLTALNIAIESAAVAFHSY